MEKYKFGDIRLLQKVQEMRAPKSKYRISAIKAEDEPSMPTVAALEDQHLSRLTKPTLCRIAEKEGVQVDNKDTKAEIVSKITDRRYRRRDMRAED